MTYLKKINHKKKNRSFFILTKSGIIPNAGLWKHWSETYLQFPLRNSWEKWGKQEPKFGSLVWHMWPIHVNANPRISIFIYKSVNPGDSKNSKFPNFCLSSLECLCNMIFIRSDAVYAGLGRKMNTNRNHIQSFGQRGNRIPADRRLTSYIEIFVLLFLKFFFFFFETPSPSRSYLNFVLFFSFSDLLSFSSSCVSWGFFFGLDFVWCSFLWPFFHVSFYSALFFFLS